MRKNYKQAALIALQNFDLDWTQIRFNQLSDTCTFVIETNKEGTFLLRVDSGRSKEEINSEIAWLELLKSKIDVPLPKGVHDRTGAVTFRVEQGNGEGVYASLMRWVEGEHANERLTEEQIYKEGVLLAKLHKAAQELELPSGFNRPVWDEHSFRKAMLRLKLHYHCFLTDDEFVLYQSAAEKLYNWLSKQHKNKNRRSYGVIHGDLHQGNIIFKEGEPRPIDFGRCGWGYYLYDVAHTLLGLYPLQREGVIKGYESIAKLDGEWVQTLENFTVMVMIENYCHHASDPRETEGLKAEQPYALAILKNYLKGEPFLFNRIEI
ncbi:phosphotransferase enzyme family protein [Paenibacillus odorifer]|uniref:Serine kinase n=1 Tax=Paenibacillus odorifer TaxID=189426 RepID=A0A1R0X6H9_9BACL|nr:phosphotransferase [Paenibacillus odorifer]OMD30145.1 serine kinase [Paenibacillus odorifer]